MYLYLDTTRYLTIGVLNEKFQWVNYQKVNSLKSSGIIHSLIFQQLSALKMLPNQLAGMFYAAGPGSYTGIRVAEGIAQIFDWQGIKVYSFYHFDIPNLLGISSGSWCSKAFKDEIFIYSWRNLKQDVFLIRQQEWSTFKKNHKEYLCADDQEDDFADLPQTSCQIYDNPEKIFSKVLGKRCSPYYFRTLEQDFKIPSHQERGHA